MATTTAMTMRPWLRKLVLTVHLTSSVGWIGAVFAYMALGVAAVSGEDAQTVRAAWISMELIGGSGLVPMSIAALLTGVVLSVGTPWGLFRHYWVVISLVLTILSTIILVLHMPTVSAMADMVRKEDGANPTNLNSHGGDLLHAGGGLLVLLVITILNVYKPRGLTPYGWRKQQEQRKASQS